MTSLSHREADDTGTAVARVTAYVDAATAYLESILKGLSDDMDIDSRIERTSGGGYGDFVTLRLSDLRGLLATVADLCPEHVACENCGHTLCRTCDVGDPAVCGHQDAELLCDDCAPLECRECRSLMRAETRVDRHWRAS